MVILLTIWWSLQQLRRMRHLRSKPFKLACVCFSEERELAELDWAWSPADELEHNIDELGRMNGVVEPDCGTTMM